jgi:hypothetical protein
LFKKSHKNLNKMKKPPFYLLTLLACLLVPALQSYAGNAKVQVIHNCADPAADSVDVYLNGSKALDNFAFRTATSFLNIPSGVPIQIGIAPKNSASLTDTLVSFNFDSLADNGQYVIIASGVVGTGFAPNPNSVSTGFTLKVIANASIASGNPGLVSFTAFHGATDAPRVDVFVPGGPLLVNNAAYLDNTPYTSVPPAFYRLQVTTADSAVTVGVYDADLSALGGGAAVVFASGFLNPAANNNGAGFGLFAALASGDVVELPLETASLQVIHNCADPIADSVDVYIDGVKAIDNFPFRGATPTLNLKAYVPYTIAIAPKTSTSVAQAIWDETYTLGRDTFYIGVASGVVGSGFAANPNSVNTAFNVLIKAAARKQANNAGNVDFFVLHGATDAPAVDAFVPGGPLLVNDAAYTDMTGYIEVPAAFYRVQLTTADSAVTVGVYDADLSGLAGGSAIVFASGFLNPAANNNGPAFGLFAALTNGTVVELPIETSSLQVIHNCADPIADSVDVYINGEKAIDNFAFRTATPILDLKAYVPYTIAIAPKTSTNVSQAIWDETYTLGRDTFYIGVASGVVGSGFAANPNSVNTAFNVLIKAAARKQANNAGNVDFFVLHGATDAPAVDAFVPGGPLLVNNAAYTDMTGYIEVPAAFYRVQLTTADSSGTVGVYDADLSGLAGGSAIVFASGFLNPAANNNGPAFGLFAALTNGTVVELPIETTSLQVLHNCADPIADSVDVYINGEKAIDNFAFRTATPILDLKAYVPYTIAIAPKSSTSVAQAIWDETYTLGRDTFYIATASGVVGTGFAANPNGVNTAFNVLVKAAARKQATSVTNIDFFVIHGSTDAPTVDVAVQGGGTIVNDAKYTDQTDYLSVPASSYVLNIKDASGATTLVSYVADVTALAGQSGVVLASGFLNPAANNNGPAFGLYVALSSGGNFIPLAVFTSVNEVESTLETKFFPNPTNGNFNLYVNTTADATVSAELFDLSGKSIKQLLNNEAVNGGLVRNFDLSYLPGGSYIVKLTNGGEVLNQRIAIVK